MPKLVYEIKPSGEAVNVRIESDDYSVLLEEIEIDNTSVIPDIMTLHEQSYLDILNQREADKAQRQQDIVDNLPDWQTVSDSIDNATTIAAMKIIVKKLARVVYWLAKNSST